MQGCEQLKLKREQQNQANKDGQSLKYKHLQMLGLSSLQS